MLKLFKKELRLNMPKALYLFALLGAMVFIPNYPYIVGIGYSIMHIMLYFQFVNENRSQEFSATLPIKRSDIVSSTTLVIVLCQMLNFAVAAICAYPSKLINPNSGNFVGLDCNLTFFGVALICLGAYNLVVIPSYFKTGYKYGFSLLLGLITFILVYGVFETLIQAIPVLTRALDGYDETYLWARLTVFAIGIIIYPLFTFIANKYAIKKFEKVNL
ncbi:MAG: ABC-2 transporter permease [Corallococcus sp.]|nr:ABC-2 transporter permease [Bacillota bacterium]MCM1534046.1 ABC-2 transporter permease [Corallococcus sp.]